MKKILLGAAGLVAALSMTAPAAAADLPAYTKAPSMVAAIYDWTGLYIGLNGGGGSAHKCWDINNNGGTVVPPFREGCNNATGGMVGGQMGYRWQAGGWVFGIEAMGDWANFKGSNTSQFNFGPGITVTNQSKIDAIGLFTGQVGYAWNNVLWYVKGGAAVTADRYNGLIGNLVVDQATEGRWGGTVGTGVEVSFAPNWSVAVEYDHLFMGNRNNTFLSPPLFGSVLSRVDNIREDVDIGTVRVNWRWGGPVISKY